MESETEELKKQIKALQAAQNQALRPYLESCHLLLQPQIVTNKRFTTAGDLTKPEGRSYLKHIVPWVEFEEQQQAIWRELDHERFGEREVFSSHQVLQEIQRDLPQISAEMELRHYAKIAVETPVDNRLMRELLELGNLCQRFRVQKGVRFQSHTNLGPQSTTRSSTSISTSMPAASTRAGGKRARGGEADQFCIHLRANGQQVPIIAIEYKAPHKFPKKDIHAGLQGNTIHVDEYLKANDNDHRIDFTSPGLVAAVITQLFDAMIRKPVQMGWVFTGEVIIFLRIFPSDLKTVHYFCHNVGDEQADYRKTTIARSFAFVLQALDLEELPQAWHDMAQRLSPWPNQTINPLRDIPSTDSPSADPSSEYEPGPRSRANKRRNRCADPSLEQADSNEGDDDDSSTDFPTPYPSQRSPTASRPRKQHRRGNQDQGNSSGASSEVKAFSMPKITIEDRPYCTHQCLNGLASGGALDNNCPNIGDHQANHPPLRDFLDLVVRQLTTDRGVNADWKPLFIKGSRGALAKIRLSSHGYTLVGKAMRKVDHRYLTHEAAVYDQLHDVQGSIVPVCVGMIELQLPFYYDSNVYSHMILISWAGHPLSRYLTPSNEGAFISEVVKILQVLHRCQILHRDVELRNWVWDEAITKLMLVDFERAEIIKPRPSLGNIILNRKKRVNHKEVMKNTAFATEIQLAQSAVSRYVQLTAGNA